MKQRLILLAVLVVGALVVLSAGGAAVKSGTSPALVGGIEVAGLVLLLVGGIVVRVRTKA